MAKPIKPRPSGSEPERQLYELFMQTPAMIGVVKGPTFVFEFANPLYLKVVGKTDSIIGKPILEVFPELKNQDIIKILKKVYRTGESYTGNEVPVRMDMNNDGAPEHVYFNFVYQPLKNAEGTVYGIMTHAVDVTDQVVSRRRVEESESKYKNLFSTMGQGFCVIELLYDTQNRPVDYRFLEVNKEFVRQTGLKKPVGKTVRELVPNIEQHWIDIYGKVALTGKAVRFTEGSETMGRWYDVDASRSGGPESRRVALLFTNITDRKEAEQDKHDAAQQVLGVLESMGDAFFMLDKEWRIVRVNKVQEKISHIPRKKSLGKIFWDVFPGTAEPTSKYWTEYNKVMKTGKPVHFVEEYAPLDIWTEVDAYPTPEGGISVFFRDVSRRFRAEKALKESEERFRTLIEKSTDAIQMVNPEGKILYSSESIKNVLGYTSEELQDASAAPFIHPDDLDYFSEKLGGLIKDPSKPVTMQYRVKHKDGSWAWLETTGVNHLETPNINALVGTFRNITERKKAEEATEYQKSLLEAQQEVSPLGIVIISETGKIASYNQRFASMWHFPPEVMDSKMDEVALEAAQQQLVDPDEFIKRVTYLYTARKASNEQLDFKDGRVFDRYGSPIFGDEGKYYGYVWYFLDVTEQKQAQEGLKASEERLRFMAESMPQKVFTATAAGEVDYFNPQWMEYTGLTFEQIRDWGWVQFVHPDDIDENVRRWKHAIATGEPFEMEHRFRSKSGDYHWHFSRAHAMRDQDGRIIKWIGSNTDVEAVKRTLKRKTQLEEMTAILREQRAELIALNLAKDEFISLASHQLRTPATGVKQYLGMVLDEFAGEVPDAQRKMIEQANISNERQITIINDMLKVAQVDAGRVRLTKQPVDMQTVLQQAVSDHASKFAERQQKVKLHFPEHETVAEVDQDRIRMVLDNLIDNASKYTPPGKNIELKVSRARGRLKIAVRDQGVGIAPQDMDKLFRKFSRLDNPLSVTVGGTGLGLYWAKKIIDLHDGTIEVTSGEGEGTMFTVIIPVSSP